MSAEEKMEKLESRLEEQANAVDELRAELSQERAAADKRSSDLTEMMGQLLLKIGDIGSGAKGESSGQRPMPTAGGDTAVAEGGARASSPPSSSPLHETSREGDGIPVEVGPRRDQLWRGATTMGLGLIGERPSVAHGGGIKGGSRRGVRDKMSAPVLEGRKNFDSFCKKMKVYATLQGFSAVFISDPYVDVGDDSQDESSLRIPQEMYERQLDAWAFLSQALKSRVDEGTFHRHPSPRKCWEDILDRYDTKTNGQKNKKMDELTGFKIARDDNPVEKLYEMEDLRAQLDEAGMDVSLDTTYSRFVAALPDEYELEVRDLENKRNTSERKLSGWLAPDSRNSSRLGKSQGLKPSSWMVVAAAAAVGKVDGGVVTGSLEKGTSARRTRRM